MKSLLTGNKSDRTKSNSVFVQEDRAAQDMCMTCKVLERGIVLGHALLKTTKSFNDKKWNVRDVENKGSGLTITSTKKFLSYCNVH